MRRTHTFNGLYAPNIAKNLDKQGIWLKILALQPGIMPPVCGIRGGENARKQAESSFFGHYEGGECGQIYVKTVHPNVHPIDTFRFSLSTQSSTQVSTQSYFSSQNHPF